MRFLLGLALLILPSATLAFVPPAAHRGLAKTQGSSVLGARAGSALYARKLTAAEQEQEEREIQEEVDRKMRGMFNAEGKPYAPWMMNQIDVEATVRAIRRRREKEREAAEAQDTGEIFDPVAQEVTPGMGLKYRVLNDKDVELGWLTGDEKDNVGFIVFRKRTDEPGADFEELASFKTFPPLNSKGPEGGFYNFVDEDVEPGQYIYRITDQDRRNKRTLLCQAGVEVQSKGDKIKNAALVAVFGALVVGGIVGSFLYEPLQ